MSRKHPLAKCEECPLQNAPCVPTTGPAGASVAFVSRSPGKHDVRVGKPFGGPSGKVLDHLLSKYGVSRNDIITTNVVLCQTDDPPKEAIRACNYRLESEIGSCDTVIAGGTEATSALTSYRAVNRARGFQISRIGLGNEGTKKQRVVVTNNPAMVLRKSDAYPDMVSDFRRAFAPLPPPTFPKVEIINEKEQGRTVLRKWLRTLVDTRIAADLEWDDSTRRIECAGFSRSGSKSVVFGSRCFEDSESRRLISELFNRQDIRFIWHNGKADTKILRFNGIAARVDEDTFLQSYALDERPGYHTLEYLLSDKFGWPDYEPKSVKHFKTKGEFLEPVERSRYELYKYNGWDAAGTMQLFQLFDSQLEPDGVHDLYKRLLNANRAFIEVELNGFNYNIEEACNIQEREVFPRLWDLEKELRQIAQLNLLNPRSAKQIQALYYGTWELKHDLRDSGKKKLSTSTGKEVREEIMAGRFKSKPRHRRQLIAFAERHAKYAKIQRVGSNYLVGLIRRVESDGKLYCHFNIGGTVSGRTSSSDPNFQNITREGVEGIPGIRNLFLPDDGCVIMSADYSQAELRTCAKLSGDENLLGIYRDSSRSLHRERAAAFYGANYTKDEYVKSKNINFGVTYGQSAAAFAQMYHMPEKEAQAYIDSWWREFPKLKEWTRNEATAALRRGYVQSPFGHKRRFHLITDDNIGELRREAVNFLPQNIAAWLTICSLIDLVDSGVCIVATVHDSIVANVRIDEVPEVARRMETIMTNQAIKQLGWQPDDIPFTVDISVGPSWGEQEELVASHKSAA